ncbi:MAG: hypothetical protein ACLFVP_04965 [Candidatus Bathyarchaeia archaeon]
MKFHRESVEHGDREFHGALTELGNAVIALFWEGKEPRLGSTSITLPNKTSSQLFGDRGILMGRVIGEMIAKRFDEMTLVSTYLRSKEEMDQGSILVDLTRRLLRGEGNSLE